MCVLGKLHNLARAVADEEAEREYIKGGGPNLDRKGALVNGPSVVLGLGLRILKQSSQVPVTGENNVQTDSFDVKETGKRLFNPLSLKPTTYLSQFILHIAAIGDIVDGTDTTHDFNYFSVIYEWPKDVSCFLYAYLCASLKYIYVDLYACLNCCYLLLHDPSVNVLL